MSVYQNIRKLKNFIDTQEGEVTATYLHDKLGIGFYSVKDMLSLLSDLGLINYTPRKHSYIAKRIVK